MIIGKDAFYKCSSLTIVSIGNGVTNIGEHAFYSCNSLTNVTIGTNVKSIDEYAFYNCESLTSVAIPDSVTSIGSYAFGRCNNLTSVTIGNGVSSIDESAFYSCDSLTSVYINDLALWCSIMFENDEANPLYYAKNLYLKNKILTELVIPDGVLRIGNYAFYNCHSLMVAIMPDSVTSIGVSAFNNCNSLTGVTIGNGVKSISRNAFYGCARITNVTIPDSVTIIGEEAFYNCDSLTSVTIGNSVTNISKAAFYGCHKLLDVINRSTLNIKVRSTSNGYVGYYAKEVHDGESKIVNKDGYLLYSYNGVNYLLGYTGTDTELVLPNNYNGENYEIYEYAFYKCDSITSVTVPDSVTGIGSYAFGLCNNLMGITIGNGVRSIGDNAFYYCKKITSLYMNDIASWCAINFAGVQSNPACFAKYLYLKNKILTELVIPDGVTSIGAYAFGNCKSITNVIIPDSVTSIGYSAFNGCNSLTCVIIGTGVTSIANYAFSGCYKLVDVINKSELNIMAGSNLYGYVGYYAKEVHTGTSKIVNKNDYLFYTYNGVNYLLEYVGTDKELVLPDNYNGENYEIYQYAFYACDSLTSVAIGNGVTSIGDSAFYNCYSLTSVTIPNSVTSIGIYAFEACYCLTTINYKGTTTQWEAITKGLYWIYLTEYTVICIDGTLVASEN